MHDLVAFSPRNYFTFADFIFMQRKFLTNLILLLFLNLLIKPFWILGIDRAVLELHRCGRSTAPLMLPLTFPSC